MARFGDAGRVVMRQDDRGGVARQPLLHHLARVNRHMVDRALGLLFIRDQHVFSVKEQHAKLFGFAVRHGGMAIVQQRVPG